MEDTEGDDRPGAFENTVECSEVGARVGRGVPFDGEAAWQAGCERQGDDSEEILIFTREVEVEGVGEGVEFLSCQRT